MIDSRRAEFFILAGLIFFLPLYEAPKNILYTLFVGLWLYNRARAGNFGGAWTYWDSLFAAWIASAFLAALFAGLPGKEWRGFHDVLRYVALLWMISRTRFQPQQVRALFLAVVASLIVGIAQAFWNINIAQTKALLELNSVGHVNHTAVYLAIGYGLLLAVAAAYWSRWVLAERVAAIAATGFVLYAVFVTASRAAVAAALLLTCVLAISWWRRSRLAATLIFLVPLLTGGLTYALKPQVLLKHEADVDKNVTYAYRSEIWRTAMVEIKAHPWFGVGPDNYNQITPARVERLVRARGDDYDPKLFYFTSHAHSMYMTTLAERGVVGLALLLIVLITSVVMLVRHRPQASDPARAWAIWGGAASAWFVIGAIGFVNTTLHDEIALLVALLFGLWLSSRRMTA